MDVSARNKLGGVLEKTVDALKAGVTPEDIINLFTDYISAYKPDRTHG